MGLSDYLPLCGCPTCNGVGTLMVPDLAFEGRSFAVVCSHCHGVGFVTPRLPTPPRREEPQTEDIEF